MSAVTDNNTKNEPILETLKKAAKRAAGGGVAGASAMVIQVRHLILLWSFFYPADMMCIYWIFVSFHFFQVGSLMWMRTIMNYQYRYGTDLKTAARTLYKEGGVLRFYKGIGPALLQGPLSRFGDTAANAGMLALLDSFDSTRNLPVGLKTVGASAAAACFRIGLMPIDTFKTVLQVEGSKGLPQLMTKFRAHGPSVFFHGALASAAATFAGHFPWFMTYNFLNSKVPQYHDDRLKKLGRNAAIGFTCSAVSDTISNSIRVIKTYRQTSAEKVSYVQATKNVIAQDGVLGLFGRGLKTRLLANGMQGLMFSVMWKYFDEKISGQKQ